MDLIDLGRLERKRGHFGAGRGDVAAAKAGAALPSGMVKVNGLPF